MARISSPSLNQGGLFHRLFAQIVYSRVKRKLGRVVMPVQVSAHHPRIFMGYIQMEQSQLRSKLVDTKLKGFVQLRAATLVGCPF